jgi:hypothetical protein
MGNALRRRNDAELVSVIPEDIRIVFDEGDIELTWDYLEKVFHFNKKVWKPIFEEKYLRSTRELTKMEIFVRFGREHFEQAINVILGRVEGHPTWLKLIRYIVRDKIREKQKEYDAKRNYYKR